MKPADSSDMIDESTADNTQRHNSVLQKSQNATWIAYGTTREIY